MKYLCTKFKHFQDMNAEILKCQWKNETKLDKWSWRLYLWIWRLCCCCCSVTKLCPTLWDPMNCSTPGFPILHYLLEFAQNSVPYLKKITCFMVEICKLDNFLFTVCFFRNNFKNLKFWDFPGGPVVKTLCFQCRGHRFNS